MTFEFKFDPPVLSLILKGLSKLPFEESASLSQGLQREIAAQEMKAKGSIPNKSVEAFASDKIRRGRRVANGAAEQQSQPS